MIGKTKYLMLKGMKSAAEFPGVELEREGTKPLVNEEEETDKNEDATDSKQNCDLG